MKIRFVSIWLVGVLALRVVFPAKAMAWVEIDDSHLDDISGKALLDISRISPGINGAAAAPGIDTGLTFYRVALDARLDMNLNISRLQMGCGGINDQLAAGGCDIDMSYVSFLGRTSSGVANAPGSDFIMTRPYLTLAINNDGMSNREVSGIMIGAQTVTGFVSIGRVYSNGQINQESGGTCSTDPNDINCQSGMAAFSGYAKLHVNGTVSGNIQTFPPTPYTTTINQDATVTGSRMSNAYIYLTGAPTQAGIFNINANIALTESLKYLHGFDMGGVPDFFLAFGRQQIAWPNYDYTTTTTDPSGPYAVTSNTGWWMNMPSKVTINGINGTRDLSLADAIGGVFGFTIPMSNQNLGQTPAKNCFGSIKFC